MASFETTTIPVTCPTCGREGVITATSSNWRIEPERFAFVTSGFTFGHSRDVDSVAITCAVCGTAITVRKRKCVMTDDPNREFFDRVQPKLTAFANSLQEQDGLRSRRSATA